MCSILSRLQSCLDDGTVPVIDTVMEDKTNIYVSKRRPESPLQKRKIPFACCTFNICPKIVKFETLPEKMLYNFRPKQFTYEMTPNSKLEEKFRGIIYLLALFSVSLA